VAIDPCKADLLRSGKLSFAGSARKPADQGSEIRPEAL